MGVAIGATKACLQVQQSLDAIAGGVNTDLKIENFGTLQWATSSVNTSGFEGLQNNDPLGKNRSVKISYWTNPRTAASTDCTPAICTATSTNAQKYAEMTLQYCRSVQLTLDENEFRDFCGPEGNTIVQSPFAQRQVAAYVNQLLAGIDTDAATVMAAKAGNFYGSIAGPKTITLIRSDGSPYHGGATTIMNDYEDIGGMGTPAAIGLGYLRTYSKTAAIACCDQTGVDLSRLNSPFVYYSDRRVETVTAVNRFYVLQPGAFQVVSRVRWIGPYDDVANGLARSDQAKTNVTVPVPGGGSIPIDFSVYRDFCGGSSDGNTKWILTWAWTGDFFTLPADTEAVGSAYRSVNGILAYSATCGDITCADPDS